MGEALARGGGCGAEGARKKRDRGTEGDNVALRAGDRGVKPLLQLGRLRPPTPRLRRDMRGGRRCAPVISGEWRVESGRVGKPALR